MVISGLFKRFRRETKGVVLAEALLTLPIVLLMVTAMVELGMGMYQWNQTVRAVQIGARLAAVSSPLATNYDASLGAGFTDSNGDALPEGDPIPSGNNSISCGAGGNGTCDATRLSRIVFGSDGRCAPNNRNTVAGMCDIAPWITTNNIRVTYTLTGLGYVGRPNGIATTVTVEVRDVYFDFIFLDAFIGGNGFAIPAHPVSFTSEDLSSCNTRYQTCT